MVQWVLHLLFMLVSNIFFVFWGLSVQHVVCILTHTRSCYSRMSIHFKPVLTLLQKSVQDRRHQREIAREDRKRERELEQQQQQEAASEARSRSRSREKQRERSKSRERGGGGDREREREREREQRSSRSRRSRSRSRDRRRRRSRSGERSSRRHR